MFCYYDQNKQEEGYLLEVSDIQQTKRRPRLVLLDTGDQDIIVAKITIWPPNPPYRLLTFFRTGTN